MSFLKNIFGSRNQRYINTLLPTVKKINELEATIKPLSDDELKAKTVEFRNRLAAGEKLDNLLPEAFATVREAARRTLGERHYDVQLIGGMILHNRRIAEMKTGEGKTLVSTLATYLNALPGKGVHVVTVNDYLAKRDATWMSRVFDALGMTTGYIIGGMTDEERRGAYSCDITYATNNELGFDYLRDNMKFSADQMVQRDLHYAIIDEVDSILIDEARTPLIISGPTEDRTELYRAVDKIIPRLKEEADWQRDEKMRQVALTEAGMDTAEELLKKDGIIDADSSLYDIKNVSVVHHINQALRAHTLFKRDRDYIVKDDKVVIIDEFTGRMMQGRRYSDGLHQALEAKEKVTVQNENQTLASITFQNFFRMYTKLGGMTGTADTEAEEFESIYGLQVVVVPTNIPVKRIDEADRIYRTVPEKYAAIVEDIKDCASRGQPVLVGTSSIESSESLSATLTKAGIKHNVLNARYHEQEAEIIAQAGRKGAVTIATNMAGRGTDIKLGGNLELMLAEAGDDKAKQDEVRAQYQAEKEAVMAAGGLRVLGTERHESRRIDNQLRGRSGRQGDVGSSVFYLSLQDELMRIFAPNLDQTMARLNMQEGEVIQNRLISAAIEAAQRKIEARNFDIRKNLLKFDDVHNNQRKVMYEHRREIMSSDAVDDIIADFREEVLEDLIAKTIPPQSLPEQWNINGLKEESLRIFAVHPPIDEWMKEEIDVETLATRLAEYIDRVYKEKEQRFGAEMLRRAEKGLLLQVMDQQWKDHLQRLDYLREGVGLRGFAQRDPLNEYKKEAFTMFEAMMGYIREETITYLYHAEIAERDVRNLPGEEGYVNRPEATGEDEAATEGNPYANMNIGRNQACPCGSGRKYKHCHGAIAVSA